MSSDITKFEPSNLKELMDFAGWLAKSSLMPRALQGKPFDVAIVMLKGHDLGLTAMQSLGSIDVIEGKPSLSAELVVALCLKQGAICEAFEMVESSDSKATYKAKRKGGAFQTLSFTIEQATKAGLTGKDNWKKNSAAMLRARASKALAKVVFPDLMLGVITPDEAEEIAASLEKDITPARMSLPANMDATATEPPAPSKPLTQTEKVKAALAKKKPPAVVDVQTGETEEQATARVNELTVEPTPEEAREPGQD